MAKPKPLANCLKCEWHRVRPGLFALHRILQCHHPALANPLALEWHPLVASWPETYDRRRVRPPDECPLKVASHA